MPSLIFLPFFLIYLLSTFHCSLVHCTHNIPLVPALYVFGDSIVDGGNINALYPFGVDLDPNLPHRFTNGLNIADYIALSLGLPLVPPYKSDTVAPNCTTGINYAFAGSGILPETNNMGIVVDFDQQINNFEKTRNNHLVNTFNPYEFKNHLEKSIYLISFAINDYTSRYIDPNSGESTPDIKPEIFAKYLLNSLAGRLIRLYRLGARKFVVKNIWPLGCAPKYNTNVDRCNATVNDIVRPYNNSMPLMLQSLATDFDGFEFAYTNDFYFFDQLNLVAKISGITNITGNCWDKYTKTLCSHRDTYLYLDDLHPTQAANRLYALGCFNGTLCSPKNIIQLAGGQA